MQRNDFQEEEEKWQRQISRFWAPAASIARPCSKQPTLRSAILGAEADIEYITDMAEIRKFIMMTPGLIINGKIAHQGKPLPNVEKVKELIKKAG